MKIIQLKEVEYKMKEKIVESIENANYYIEEHPMPFVVAMLFFYTVVIMNVF